MSDTPKRKRSPWYAFYVDDFLGGTEGMSTLAVGAYIRLLNYQFLNGSIPSDDEDLMMITRLSETEWAKVGAKVLPKFEPDESGNLVNYRMKMERDERNEIREKRIASSRLGNEKRWSKDSVKHANALPSGIPNGIANGIPNGTVLGIASTTTTTTTSLSTTKSKRNHQEGINKEAVEKKASKARPRSREEFDAYFKDNGLYPRDAEYLWNKWESNGWESGKSKIKDWKAAVRTWKVGKYLPSQKDNQIETDWPKPKTRNEQDEDEDLMAKLLAIKAKDAREAAGDHPDFDPEWKPEELEEGACF